MRVMLSMRAIRQIPALLLPALIPSWSFFRAVAPSPRIEFRWLQPDLGPEPINVGVWQEFRPRPHHLPLMAHLKGLFWNPHWNQTLFLVSCSERLIINPNQHALDQIKQRIEQDLLNDGSALFLSGAPWQFQLVFINRNANQLETTQVFVSPEFAYCADCSALSPQSSKTSR